MDQMPYSNDADPYNVQPSEDFGGYAEPAYREYASPPVPRGPGYRPAAQPPAQPPYAGPVSVPPANTPGSGPPRPPAPGRKRPRGLLIAGVVLTVIVLLAAGIAGVSNLPTHRSTTQATATPVPTQPGHPTSAFQSAPCPFQPGTGIVEGQQVTCGYVTVPQNRNVNDGRTVKLALAIFKAPHYLKTPDPDPVLRLDGGPGGPSLTDWASYITATNYDRFIFDHDLIMFDQRGTGYSTPSLKCPELISLQYSPSGSQQDYEQAARTCYNRLVAQGIDLNGYNSLQNAADVRDLIHALGYQQMTLYGVSYGTRLALTVMRLYPSVVHAAVLDSVYPPNHNRTDLPLDAQRVFRVFFQGCAKDASCTAKYPDLEHVFYTLVNTLNAHPISFDTVDPATNRQYTVSLGGDDLIGWLFGTLYVTSLIALLPQTIYQIRAHDYRQLASLYGPIMFDDTFSDGMFYSTTCSEDWAFLTQQDIVRSLQGITPQIAKVFGLDEQEEYDICQFWKVQAVPAAQKLPVSSNLPTLVLAGEYDPITPPANAQEVAQDLSHSYYFLFPGQGHGQEYSSECSDEIISAFEDTPNLRPSGACISQMTEPAFQ
jgi:pimeloyl-ACP methyl ester carboxylesterase